MKRRYLGDGRDDIEKRYPEYPPEYDEAHDEEEDPREPDDEPPEEPDPMRYDDGSW